MWCTPRPPLLGCQKIFSLEEEKSKPHLQGKVGLAGVFLRQRGKVSVVVFTLIL